MALAWTKKDLEPQQVSIIYPMTHIGSTKVLVGDKKVPATIAWGKDGIKVCLEYLAEYTLPYEELLADLLNFMGGDASGRD